MSHSDLDRFGNFHTGYYTMASFTTTKSPTLTEMKRKAALLQESGLNIPAEWTAAITAAESALQADAAAVRGTSTSPSTSPRLASLGPENIDFYFMQTESVRCAHCGSVERQTRMWISYSEGKSRTSRPLGASESIYAGVEIRRVYKDLHTRACEACIETFPMEKWTPRTPNVTGASNFTAAPAVPTSKPKAPKPHAKTLSQLLAEDDE